MQTTVNLWPLLGVLVIVVGFVLRFNPLLVVALAAVATGIAAQFSPEALLAAIGTGFIKARALPLIILLPLAVIGLLERHGLRLHGRLPEALRQRLLAFCAATDNVGLFFGEDIFVAFGAIALMHTFLLGAGLDVEPLHIALWGIPTALCAFFIHALRLHRFDRQLYRELTANREVRP